MKVLESLLETNPIRVALVDPHQLFRAGIKAILSQGSDMTIVAEAANRTEAIVLIQRERPDVVLMDSMVLGDDMELIGEMIVAAGEARILIMTGGGNDTEIQRKAVRLGVRGLLSKNATPEMLTKAVQRIYAGEVWLDRTTTAAVFDELSRGTSVKPSPEEMKMAALTDREREVIRAVGEGLKNKQIGERLFISDVTVRHHLTSIFSKLGVTDRLELVIYAYRNGLAPIPK